MNIQDYPGLKKLQEAVEFLKRAVKGEDKSYNKVEDIFDTFTNKEDWGEKLNNLYNNE